MVLSPSNVGPGPPELHENAESPRADARFCEISPVWENEERG